VSFPPRLTYSLLKLIFPSSVVDPGLCRSDITRDEKLGAVGM
jgi:hypothetical protein